MSREIFILAGVLIVGKLGSCQRGVLLGFFVVVVLFMFFADLSNVSLV